MSSDGCKCCLLQCRDEFRWFNMGPFNMRLFNRTLSINNFVPLLISKLELNNTEFYFTSVFCSFLVTRFVVGNLFIK